MTRVGDFDPDYTVGGHEKFETTVVHVPSPGETCALCTRRVPHPKKSTSPTTRPLAYRIPLDEADAHLEVLDAVAELLGISEEKFHRFKTISYCAAAVLQGARLTERDGTDEGDWCVICGSVAVHTHHRKLRSQGGDNSPANLMRVCLLCHEAIHHNPASSYLSGYLVKSWQDPAKIQIV